MRNYLILIGLLATFYAKAQIEPLVDYDWTIEKIENFDGTTILADPLPDGSFNKLVITYNSTFDSYGYLFSSCGGTLLFENANFDIIGYSCAISPDHTNIADHFLNVFILEEGGLTVTDDGNVYGPFSYDFTYSESGDIVYLHITNLAGSVATFFASTLSQEEFLKESITIYPNPATDILKIESTGVTVDNIKIYDLRGRLVEKYDGVKTQIDVGHLQKGIFILHIETDVGVLSKKLIIQ